MSEMKPCPFCGRTSRGIKSRDVDDPVYDPKHPRHTVKQYFIRCICNGDMCVEAMGYSKSKAIAAWNYRDRDIEIDSLEANDRLIALAPELLKVIEDYLKGSYYPYCANESKEYVYREIIERMEQLVARVKGDQNGNKQ